MRGRFLGKTALVLSISSAFAYLAYRPLPCGGFGGAAHGSRARMSRSMENGRDFRGNAKELKEDCGVIRVHQRWGAM